MKILIAFTTIVLGLAPSLYAQANPVVSSSRELYSRQSGYIVAAAEQMPADKYGFSPTPSQWTFGKIVAHITDANSHVCTMLTPANQSSGGPATSEKQPKEALVAALKASFQTCDKAFANLQDSSLGDPIKFFGGRSAPRARALLEEIGDLEDHYSQMAIYMRLNGLTPPSAAKK